MLRDTFAGKMFSLFQNQIPVSKFLSNFYRQKCRAAAEILGAWEPEKKYCHLDIYNYESHLYYT